MITIPDTNAKGWHRWCLIDTETKEVVRIQYKPEAEVDADNKLLIEHGNNYLWILMR